MTTTYKNLHIGNTGNTVENAQGYVGIIESFKYFERMDTWYATCVEFDSFGVIVGYFKEECDKLVLLPNVQFLQSDSLVESELGAKLLQMQSN